MLSSGLLAQIHGHTEIWIQCEASELQLSGDYMPGVLHSNLSGTQDLGPCQLVPSKPPFDTVLSSLSLFTLVYSLTVLVMRE